MANNNVHINYTQADIERYLQGKMTHAEMHALEKAALQDPFLADAIEGFAIADLDKAKMATVVTQRLIEKNLSQNPTQKNYTLTEIEAYYTGKLNFSEQYELEKTALKDPLLADAIEGYENTNFNAIKTQLSNIENKINGVHETSAKVVNISAAKSNKQWLRIAAAIILMIGVGSTVWIMNNKQTTIETPIAYIPEEVKPSTNNNAAIKEVQDSNATITIPDAVASAKKSSKTATIPTLPNNDFKNEPPATAGVAAFTEDIASTKESSALIREKSEQLNIAESKKRQAEADEQLASAKTKEAETKLATKPVVTRAVSEKMNAPTNASKQYFNNNYNRSNTFRGRVQNTDGENLASTTIHLRNNNTNILARTDQQGNFSVQLPDTTAVVAVDAMGYHQQQINLSANRANNIIVEKQEENSLSETVVIGYGNAKKNNKLSSAQKTLANEIANAAVEPIGGWLNFNQYVEKEIENLKSGNIQDADYKDTKDLKVEFKVQKDGSPTNIQIEGTQNEQLQIKAVDIIKKGPKWKTSKKSKKVKLIIQL